MVVASGYALFVGQIVFTFNLSLGEWMYNAPAQQGESVVQ